jgi:hypothetical protein
LKKAHENWLILEKQEKMERLNKKIAKLELEFEI